MCYFTQGRFQQQVRFLRRQFLQDGEMPFGNVLSEEIVAQAVTAIEVVWKDRIYTPLVTLWMFLGQVSECGPFLSGGRRPLDSASCFPRDKARARRRQVPTARQGSVCPRRFSQKWLVRLAGRWIRMPTQSGFGKAAGVYAYDGSTVSMPDTPENQKAYPQPAAQKPGLGFPLARIAAVVSLSCGAVLDLGICRYAGKGQSELGMLRSLWDMFLPGDVLLADRLDVLVDGHGHAQETWRRFRVTRLN